MKLRISVMAVSWAVAAAVVLTSPLALPQEFRSTLTGEVTDPSGAVVPNAKITAVKNDAHQTYAAQTNGSGIYTIPYVLPGLYTVTARATGFQTQVQESVLLEAAAQYELDFKLRVGSVSQQVTVSAAPLINTASGSSANILTGREVGNIPLNGRQIYMLLSTTPGSQFLTEVFGASGNSGTRGWDVTNNYTLGGAVSGYNMFTLNGTNITNMAGFGGGQGEGAWMTAPSADAIQEVNIQTNTYDAKYGHTAGGTVNIVMKAGTNRYHGDLYEYLENGAFNANNFESNFAGLPTANTIQHQYGGTVGGPIKKDKLFFFGSFEGYWQSIPFTTLSSVPPAYLHPGPGEGVDFTRTGYTIYNPLTTVCRAKGGTVGNCPGNSYTRQEFPNDTIPVRTEVVNGVTIPGINATGAALLSYFPLPNTNFNSIRDNYISRTPDTYRYYQPMSRVDYTTSERTKWYTSFEWQKGHEFRDTSGFTGPAENGDINSERTNVVITQDMTHVFSSSMVGDFNLAFTRYSQRFPNGASSMPAVRSLGLSMPAVPTTTKDLLPQITFSETYPQIIGNTVSTQMNQTMALRVDFTKTHGTHSMEFGGEVGRWNFANPFNVGHPNGTFRFGTQPTQKNPLGRSGDFDGNVIADLLLGYPDSGGVDWQHTVYETIPEYALYSQDNWRVNHRLMLNIGLRYDLIGGLFDRFNGLNRGMCLSCVNPITNDPTYQANITNANNLAAWHTMNNELAQILGGASGPAIDPGAVYGGIEFAGANGQPRTAYNIDWGNLAPRVGFAYALNDKTVIRGGWGWMFAYGIEGGTRSGFSITTPYVNTLTGGATPTTYFQTGDPYPNGVIQPVGAALGLETNLGNAQNLDFPQRKIPRSTVMSLGIQRELARHTLLSVKYSGNYARALRTLDTGSDINGVLPLTWGYPDLQQTTYRNPCTSPACGPNTTIGSALAAVLNAQAPNPYYGVVPAASSLGQRPTIEVANLLTPYSQYGQGLQDYTNPYGKSWYDSLQVKLDKRLYGRGRGLSYQLAYTYSKNMELNYYINKWPWQDTSPVYEPVNYDRNHIFTLAGEWDLPMGRGAGYLFRHASGAWGEAINGWRLSWIFSESSGRPQDIPGGWHVSPHSLAPDGGPTFSQWIYNCAFPAKNPTACYTNIPSWGRGNQPQRVGYLRQPHIPNLDMSLQKSFRLTESEQLQFRWETFNVMNSVLFPEADHNQNDKICGPITIPACTQWTGFGTVRMYQNNFPRIMQLSLKLLF